LSIGAPCGALQEKNVTTLVQEQSIATALKAAEVIVRVAGDDDVDAIVAIVAEHARQGHLLPRSPDNIRASLPTWRVAEVQGRVVGIGSLLAMNEALVEVRSLAVLPEYRSLGVGAALVCGLVVEARRQGYATAFALTRAVPFFLRLGFAITTRDRFPQKVWRDCVICPLYHACDETAVALELQPGM
jgi:amino-acid N-acetyltransferase